jgi:hypothetical protein
MAMRIYRYLVVTSAIVLAVSCMGRQESAAPEGPAPVGTVREVMHGIVEYQANVLFNAVTVTVSATGTEEKQPRTDEDWDVVEHAALTLAESANLLTVPGRRVATPEEEKADPTPGELPPLEIQAKIQANRDLWLRHVKDLQATAMEALQITHDRSLDGLFAIGEKIDQACESCHLEFWYPDEQKR